MTSNVDTSRASVEAHAKTCGRALLPETAKVLLALRDDLDRAKREAFEEAAEICDEQAATFLTDEYSTGQPLASFGERFACNCVKEAISARAAAKEAM